jgi:hypothetical protein
MSVLAHREIWMLQKSVAIGAWRTRPVPLFGSIWSGMSLSGHLSKRKRLAHDAGQRNIQRRAQPKLDQVHQRGGWYLIRQISVSQELNDEACVAPAAIHTLLSITMGFAMVKARIGGDRHRSFDAGQHGC